MSSSSAGARVAADVAARPERNDENIGEIDVAMVAATQMQDDAPTTPPRRTRSAPENAPRSASQRSNRGVPGPQYADYEMLPDANLGGFSECARAVDRRKRARVQQLSAAKAAAPVAATAAPAAAASTGGADLSPVHKRSRVGPSSSSLTNSPNTSHERQAGAPLAAPSSATRAVDAPQASTQASQAGVQPKEKKKTQPCRTRRSWFALGRTRSASNLWCYIVPLPLR